MRTTPLLANFVAAKNSLPADDGANGDKTEKTHAARCPQRQFNPKFCRRHWHPMKQNDTLWIVEQVLTLGAISSEQKRRDRA